jgi:hypothetical protein
MGSEQVPCNNCGALMVPQTDGRTYHCPYCQAHMLVAVDAGQIASGLRADLSNADAFLAQLARALYAAIPEQIRVNHRGGWVMALEIHLDPDVYVARREPHGVVAQHKKVVRGIALKTNTHPLDRWYEMLTASLAAHANTSARAAQALAMLKGDDR